MYIFRHFCSSISGSKLSLCLSNSSLVWESGRKIPRFVWPKYEVLWLVATNGVTTLGVGCRLSLSVVTDCSPAVNVVTPEGVSEIGLGLYLPRRPSVVLLVKCLDAWCSFPPSFVVACSKCVDLCGCSLSDFLFTC